MTYTPRGYPLAAIKHLRRLPAGASCSSAELADAIGTTTDSLSGLMAAPVSHGLICRLRDPHDVRRMRWALGDGTSAPSRRWASAGWRMLRPNARVSGPQQAAQT